ncbi:hypothetical protein SGGMMB4_04072 [Sodalis glossinidius str. 'morsitans']|uniref:Uncharacterized protein n=1 Tax=Sodalis glossinidius (strain morsitans) TaxID=343509 RepID=A0A193QL74_SODGM|nr:hypothetical protein [Sodalis glossinidius]CRL45917.1 hypothetical protein SGGMMB4_04072 [Sodalis glossinidius str. 'morsitans']
MAIVTVTAASFGNNGGILFAETLWQSSCEITQNIHRRAKRLLSFPYNVTHIKNKIKS